MVSWEETQTKEIIQDVIKKFLDRSILKKSRFQDHLFVQFWTVWLLTLQMFTHACACAVCAGSLLDLHRSIESCREANLASGSGAPVKIVLV